MNKQAVIYADSHYKISLSTGYILNSLLSRLNKSLPEIFPYNDYKLYERIDENGKENMEAQRVIICVGQENYLKAKNHFSTKNKEIRLYRVIDTEQVSKRRDLKNIRGVRLSNNLRIQELFRDIEHDLLKEVSSC